MISMNMSPPRATAERKLESTPNVKARMRNSGSLNIGCAMCASTNANHVSRRTPAAMQPSTKGLVQPIGLEPCGRMPYVIPIMIRTRPTANVAFPIQSIGARLRTPISLSLRCDHTVPTRPNGTETRNTSRQSMGASSPPTRRPMNWPLIPTTLLRPSASPRWFAGNASVRIAAEFAIRNAAPTPCTSRKPISQSAPAEPCIQSIVSRSDATV